MESKFRNLHSKTVYDFTDDEQLIQEITVIDKESYLDELKKNPLMNAFHLLELAEHIKDKSLESAVYSQYGKELKDFYNE